MAGGGVSENGDPGFQIAPMVDVVFVLLLFFMASAGSQVVERELNINLPSGRAPSGVTESNITPIVISITEGGNVILNDKEYDGVDDKDLPSLRAQLKDIFYKFGNDNPVIIRPEPGARHERIIDVLNSAAACGVTKLTFG